MTRTDRYATILTPGDRDMYIERIVDAPRDRVWAAHTVPACHPAAAAHGSRWTAARWRWRPSGENPDARR